MNEPYPVKTQEQKERAPLTSRLNDARTADELVRLLASESLPSAIAYDHCSLILPAQDGKGVRIYSAASSTGAHSGAAVKQEAMRAVDPFLSALVNDGASSVLCKDDLQGDAARAFGLDVCSVLALPLRVGGNSTGLLCFASAEKDAYTIEDAESLQWLADHVAALAQAARLRSQLELMAETEREIARLKSGFINTLLRDVRFPLTSVLGLLELFESKLQAREQFDLEDRQLLGSALENGDRMRRLLDNHLEVAQQQDRPLVLAPEDVNVLQLLEETVEPLRAEAALRGVELNVHVGAVDLSMHVDVRETRRALCHLLTVALDATQDGGAVQLEAQTILGTRVGDEGRRFVVINVTDSGRGIPAEEIPFIFDAFWQSSNSSANAVRGIGLAIAKRVAAAHGGNVSVRSQLGAGTTFSIILPAVAQHALCDAKRQRVLVVDDVPEILLLLGKLVGRMGYEALMASCAEEALQVLGEQSIDLLLTDWAMPGMNGGELIATIKRDARWREIPTIVLTGHDTDTERSQARAAGCDRFLVKPVKRDLLQTVISELISGKKVEAVG